MVNVTIDPTKGLLANEWCPVTQREWFRSGAEPTQQCRVHGESFDLQLEEIARRVERTLRRVLRF
jgi:hypothetical protein